MTPPRRLAEAPAILAASLLRLRSAQVIGLRRHAGSGPCGASRWRPAVGLVAAMVIDTPSVLA
jgi:hypothetical protein